MHIALSKEQIPVGRIFTLASCPFPGRSIYVAEESLGVSANARGVYKDRGENEAGGLARGRFDPVGAARSQTGAARNRGERRPRLMAELLSLPPRRWGFLPGDGPGRLPWVPLARSKPFVLWVESRCKYLTRRASRTPCAGVFQGYDYSCE